MPMKNPPHPGRLLRADIEALELSVAEAAKGLGVTRQQLYNVINGKSAITPDMAVRLEAGIAVAANASSAETTDVTEDDGQLLTALLTSLIQRFES